MVPCFRLRKHVLAGNWNMLPKTEAWHRATLGPRAQKKTESIRLNSIDSALAYLLTDRRGHLGLAGRCRPLL